MILMQGVVIRSCYNNMVKEEVCRYENLYSAMLKCKRNVLWKDSVAGFTMNGLVNCYKLRSELLNGTYKICDYSVFTIKEPKERVIVSTRFRDRVVQRSLCDNYLTEAMSRPFIYDNCACQVGKGTHFARNRLKHHLRDFYKRFGTNGYVLKCDVKSYFGSTRHDIAIAAVRKRVDDEWAVSMVEDIINSFDHGPDPDVGIGLGSQVSQLIQLAVLDDLDHFIKEKLKIKNYVRYMDDFILIHQSKEHLKWCRTCIEEELSRIGLKLSTKKTQVFPVTQNIPFLGFTFRLTDTGGVKVRLIHNKISKFRRKLRRLVRRANDGHMTREDVDASFQCWQAHASYGDCKDLIRAVEEYYYQCWEE